MIESLVSTYMYGAFDGVLLSCHVRDSDYIFRLYIRLYLIIMSLTSFRVNTHSLVCPNVKELIAQGRRHI